MYEQMKGAYTTMELECWHVDRGHIELHLRSIIMFHTTTEIAAAVMVSKELSDK
jgi:hypothetical protein